jgi:hypothetical protein
MKCSICTHPNLAEIDSLLDAGTNQKDAAAQFGVSRFALSRHVRHSAPAPMPEPGTSEPLETQAARWMERADAIYQASTANGDVRGQVQALTGAFRGLELQHRAELKVAESTPPAGDGTPVTIEEIDRIVQSTLNETQRGKNLNRLFDAPDAVLEIAVRVLDAPESWGAVETVLEGRV